MIAPNIVKVRIRHKCGCDADIWSDENRVPETIAFCGRVTCEYHRPRVMLSDLERAELLHANILPGVGLLSDHIDKLPPRAKAEIDELLRRFKRELLQLTK